jgi:4-hydroxy-tetrahydrodipicolinate reductase
LRSEDLGNAQVAIEFTQPDSAVENAVTCLRLGCPVVIGTTGWASRMAELKNAVAETGTPALWSPNYSLGVQLFLAIAEDAARRLRQVPGFETVVIETHHSAKKDAPSGTGIAIAQRIASGLGHDVPVTSVRVGAVPGTHEVVMDAPFEQIRLVHEARDRRVFADGALAAARWLASAPVPAIYTMQDVLATYDREA